MISTVTLILANMIPIFFMIGLIPIVTNDLTLALIYLGIIGFSFFIKHHEKELLIFSLGAILMTIFEWIFLKTGVETFTRQSLLGVMPLWLPILWGYGFVAIKRTTEIIKKKY